MSDTPFDEKIIIFKALSDFNRLRIMDILSCGEICACKILEDFDITQPTLSHHMKVLMDCRLVIGRKEGKWMHYSINKEKVDEFIEFIQYLTNDKENCICKVERGRNDE
ncbi:MAG: metalloregulator ArsR/SmtB family transcription factor [Clostridia bacterium]|nr:metalloregulator ArsR/SmtB family transcription factor [Clostridia bacterium]